MTPDPERTATLMRPPSTPGRAGTVVAVLAVVLAACGGTAAAPPAETAGTVTLSAANGEVTVPVTDTGIWALDDYTAMRLLALGVEPTHAGRNHYTGDQVVEAGYELLGAAGVELVEPDNVELVAAAAPTLIVGTDDRADLVEQLRPIAPVLLIDDNAPWDRQLELLAAATGREAEAGAVIERLDAAVEDTAGRIAASEHAGATVSLLSACGEQFCVYDSVRTSGALLDRFGLERPPGQRGAGNEHGYLLVSGETIDEHVADVVIVYTGSVAFGAASPLEHPLFDTSDSVTAEVDFGAWFGTGPLDVAWILNDLRAVLLGEGEIATAGDAPELWAAVVGEG